MQSLVHWIIERLDHISRYCLIKYSVPQIIDITRAWLLILKCDIVYLPREITSEKIGISFLLKVHRHYKTYIILLEKRYPILRVSFVICNGHSNIINKETLVATYYLLSIFCRKTGTVIVPVGLILPWHQRLLGFSRWKVQCFPT